MPATLAVEKDEAGYPVAPAADGDADEGDSADEADEADEAELDEGAADGEVEAGE